MVWKELGYCLVLARLAPRVSMGRCWAGRQMGKCSLLISNYFITASSHQANTGSGCTHTELLTCSILCSKSATEPETVSTTPASHICPLTSRLFIFVSPCAVTDRHVERWAICKGQENAVYPVPESQNSLSIQKFCDRKRFCECQHFHIITVCTQIATAVKIWKIKKIQFKDKKQFKVYSLEQFQSLASLISFHSSNVFF